MKDMIAIIILNYNGLPYILDCLKALQTELGKVKNQKIKVIVVDNDSQDRSVKLIIKKYTDIKIIKNRKNLGFASGNNTAIRWALKNKYDYILLLNPDAIVKNNFLKPLIQLIKSDKKIGIAAPALMGKEGGKTIYALGARFNPIIGRVKHVHVEKAPLEKEQAELVSGCAMLVRKSVFEKIGLLDKRFFLYFEDSDFCIRSKKAGYKIFVEPKSLVFHQTSKSLGGLSLQKTKYILGSNLKFIKKWVNPIFWPMAFIYLVFLGTKMMINIFWSKQSWPERIVPGWHSRFSVCHHLGRYYFSAKLIKMNDIVLDAACGSGYGTKILSYKAKKVIGIDHSTRALLTARLLYQQPKIRYQQMNCYNLKFKTNYFNKVVSLETIEHLADAELFLAQVQRVLKPGGVFIVSTPNPEAGRGAAADLENPWHLKEYDIKEFKELLRPYFRKITIYSQIRSRKAREYQARHEKTQEVKKALINKDRLIIRGFLPRPLKNLIWTLYTKTRMKALGTEISHEDFPIKKGIDKNALIYLAVCQK